MKTEILLVLRAASMMATATSAKSSSAGWCVPSLYPLHPDSQRAQIEEGTARPLLTKFDVKKRAYFGNTSMEAEISLLMANQTLVSPAIRSTAPPISSATGLVREADV